MQNLTQIDPSVWSVGGGAIDLAPAHFQLRAHLYKPVFSADFGQIRVFLGISQNIRDFAFIFQI